MEWWHWLELVAAIIAAIIAFFAGKKFGMRK